MSAFKTAGTLLSLLRRYVWAAVAVIGVGVLSSLAEGIGISLFIPFLQLLEQGSGEAATGTWLIDSLGRLFADVPAAHRLPVILGCIFGSIAAKALLAYGGTVLFTWMDARVGHQLRSRLFNQLLTVGYGFIERSEFGPLLNTLSTESWRAGEALWHVVNIIVTSCTLVVYVTLLLLISWQLTLAVAVAMAVISMIIRLVTRRVKAMGQQETRANAVLATRMVEGLEGMKVIRTFGREPYEQACFDAASQRVSRLGITLGFLKGAIHPIYEVLTATLLVGVLYSSFQTSVDLPALLVFLFVLYRLQPRVNMLDNERVALLSLTAAVEEVMALLDRSDKPYVRSGTVPYRGVKDAIRFERVTFSYEGTSDPALQEVSLRIAAGKTTALVGPSGAGKSTLIKLLFRFYDVSEGEIYVDAHPLRALDLNGWRSRIAMVSQDVYLFDKTVRENIAYGRLDATEEEIVAAAKRAHAHDFIRRLPQGYDTRVGDRGVRLSGGQQQRITLARAIVRDPEILILDEATNALDSLSEHLIQEALDILSSDRTVIVIAHRLSTIEKADHIVVLEEGRVREQGRLHQLLDQDGLFARMHALQYSGALP